MSEIAEGSILDIARENCLIMHQVNCLGVISDEIHKKIAEKYPDVAGRYKRICRKFKDNPRELSGEILYHEEKGRVFIADSFSQFGVRAYIKQTDDDLLTENIEKGAEFADKNGLIFYIPYGIGTSGRGSWPCIYEKIKHLDIVIVKPKEI